ncbi:MAG: hypothetical protein K6G33_12970 [Ruminococcus sp.]|uniref:hypothetical protein n=1 Tax=Ruminococcus sp. TaxID=41978 RepID=UPI0025DD7F0E|nr:hypothetical protein [Ruminococcus sp.]MCR5601642.1 hypothetical protein [Ruminococcus sp.]
MERTLTAVSAVILLIGCCTGCGKGKIKQAIPKICFMYYRSFEKGAAGCFCDSSGNCYTILSADVMSMKLEELIANYEAGKLEKDIKFLKKIDEAELEEAYMKLQGAVAKEKCELRVPDALSEAEAPRESWYGVYYDENNTPARVEIHANRCMTDINSVNKDVNEVYEWFSGSLNGNK